MALAAAAALILLPACAKKAAPNASAKPSGEALIGAPSQDSAQPSPGDHSVSEGLNGADAPQSSPQVGGGADTQSPSPGLKKPAAPTGAKWGSAIGPYDISQLELPSISSEAEYLSFMKAHTKQSDKLLRQKWARLQVDNRWYPDNTAETQKAFLMVPREEFIRSWNLGQVYEHTALPIEDGQTISGPHLVTRMTNNINPKPGMKVLEIGTGSGYQSAVLSFMTDQVYTIEIKANLAANTNAIYQKLEKEYPTLRNVKRMNADGYFGWEEYAPFDRIIVTCGIDHIPPALLKQLKTDGVMVIPIGPMNGEQVILKITKRVDAEGNVTLERQDIYGGKIVQGFVPFTAGDGSWHQKNK